jgi:hypothetical protein
MEDESTIPMQRPISDLEATVRVASQASQRVRDDAVAPWRPVEIAGWPGLVGAPESTPTYRIRIASEGARFVAGAAVVLLLVWLGVGWLRATRSQTVPTSLAATGVEPASAPAFALPAVAPDPPVVDAAPVLTPTEPEPSRDAVPAAPPDRAGRRARRLADASARARMARGRMVLAGIESEAAMMDRTVEPLPGRSNERIGETIRAVQAGAPLEADVGRPSGLVVTPDF